MEGPDETTELWRPPSCYIVTFCYLDPGKVGIPSYGDPKGLGTFFIALVTVAVFYQTFIGLRENCFNRKEE